MNDSLTFFRDGTLVRDVTYKECYGYSKKEFAETLLSEFEGFSEESAAATAICVWDLYAKVEVDTSGDKK